MKITKETTLENLVPEGKELDLKKLNNNYSTDSDKCLIIPIKDKEKDFGAYIHEYFEKGFPYMYLNSDDYGNLKEYLIFCGYKEVPIEIKLGLLKHICEEKNLDFWYACAHLGNVVNRASYREIIEQICPEEFLESIFE